MIRVNSQSRDDKELSIVLKGANNFRSLKGIRARDGRRIAGHTVLRSDQLHLLEAGDWELLESLGVRTICDLRTDSERRRYPTSLPSQRVRQVTLELISDVRGNPELAAAITRKPNAEGATDMMLALYRHLPASLAPRLPTLFGLFAAGDVPVLIHCVAGKDRTGFVIAVVLHALGIAYDEVVADYMLSCRRDDAADLHRREMMAKLVFRLTGKTDSDAMVDAILAVQPAYLQAGLDAVAADYGSMENYLLACAGMGPEDLRRMRDQWLAFE